MDKFDIFECPPEGGLLWRDCAEDVETAKLKMSRLAANSKSEFQVLHVPTKVVMARVSPSLNK